MKENFMWIKRNIYYIVKYLTILLVVLFVTKLYKASPLKDDNISNVQNNLIVVSGILSGIVLAFLSAQFFQLKRERKERQIEINLLFDRLSIFRSFLYRIMRSQRIWLKHESIGKIENFFPDLSYYELHGQGTRSKEVNSFFSEPRGVSQSTVDLFLAMKEIVGSSKVEYWPYDRTVLFSYSMDYLQRILDPLGQVTYYLEVRYSKHGQGRFDFHENNISHLYQGDILLLPGKIDAKYKDRQFDRHLVVELASDFCDLHVPELIRLKLINENQISISTRILLAILSIILLTGVILPLSCQLIAFDIHKEKSITFLIVITVIGCLVHFLFDLYRLYSHELKNEIVEESTRRNQVN